MPCPKNASVPHALPSIPHGLAFANLLSPAKLDPFSVMGNKCRALLLTYQTLHALHLASLDTAQFL